MADRNATLLRGLLHMALLLVAASAIFAGVAWVSAGSWSAEPWLARKASLVSVSLTLGGMLAGFVPLWLLLSVGNENIVSAWLAAMLVRMVICLSGLFVLVKGLELPAAVCAVTLIVHYALLLGIETAALNRLVGRLSMIGRLSGKTE